ncbi:hypothetical protein BASA50_005242 [Batrachochytrium salamandrivorans]|uniref:Rab-GAP TBC domain-containing protein n=1 Tax=Batrachochytrium salamandrivorans TaxID=1357716 RepID=A0ABQ8FDI9_9FUNG|nr:hypothetical protein BASA50_005242 [Batrachochytrium salamandrivorans]
MDLRTGNRLALFELYVGAVRLPPENTFEKFRQLCLQGIPDSGSIRQCSWKLLLGYLPFNNRTSWETVLRQQRTIYYSFVNELICEQGHDIQSSQNTQDAAVQCPDNLLNSDRISQSSIARTELSILEQIDMDVRRTLPDIAFFKMPVPKSKYSPLHPTQTSDTLSGYPLITSSRTLFNRLEAFKHHDPSSSRLHSSIRGIQGGDGADLPDSCAIPNDLHWECTERILYIYAKLNPGIGYVQGMNEILGPLYYIMASDPNEESRAHAEADSFFLFTALMSEFRDHFIRHLDNVTERASKVSACSASSLDSASLAAHQVSEHTQETGIGESMNRLWRLLHQVDPELHKNLNQKKLEPVFFSFRWLSVLFTQEFSLPDIIRVWDALFADICLDITLNNQANLAHAESMIMLDSPTNEELKERPNKFEFLIEFACAMITGVRTELLGASFNDSLKLLQSYPAVDVESIISKAFIYRSKPIATPAYHFGLKNMFRRVKHAEPLSEAKSTTTNVYSKIDVSTDGPEKNDQLLMSTYSASSSPPTYMPMMGLSILSKPFSNLYAVRPKGSTYMDTPPKRTDPAVYTDTANNTIDLVSPNVGSPPPSTLVRSLDEKPGKSAQSLTNTTDALKQSMLQFQSVQLSGGFTRLFRSVTVSAKLPQQKNQIPREPSNRPDLTLSASSLNKTSILPLLTTTMPQHEIMWQRSLSVEDDMDK